MKKTRESFDDFDERRYGEGRLSEFSEIIDRAISRRSFVRDSVVCGIGVFAASTLGGLGVSSALALGSSSLLGFAGVSANSFDDITLPIGYSSEVLISWGDPLFSDVPEFDNATRGSSVSQALSFGDNTDGMSFFPLSMTRGVMVVNNEYANIEWLYASGSVESSDDALKGRMAHGVSIFEISKDSGSWSVVLDSIYNRRITADTPIELSGVGRYHDLLKTSSDSSGVVSLGTWNNCGNGETPWGTYLACEENFNGYFATSDKSHVPSADQRRYGIGNDDWDYSWYKYEDRFDIVKEPNECNRVGYVVEIDPMDSGSVPKKRTSMGRFKHENAEVVVNVDGRVVVYMGDDERGEYLYKFVTSGRYDSGNASNNVDLLDSGVLYVAKFGSSDENFSGRGEWLPLEYGLGGLTDSNGFGSQAEIAIYARKAATFVGATTMDRPEWVASSPDGSSVYCSLSNNKERGNKSNKGGVSQLVNGPNPRVTNHYGQILRWEPDGGDHTSTGFSWNLFVLAGNPLVKDGLYRGSDNIDSGNIFNSPDGLKFDSGGRLWIQSDGNYSNEGDFAGMGNNQMLCADPVSGEIRRFLVGPVACEITGFAMLEDGRTMFVGIQHPGELGADSHYPDGGDSVPRSSIIVIKRDDGGVIGAV